ncbi:winged helix-turn-helix transcriptional regulator [Streptomyces sp. NPDC002845]
MALSKRVTNPCLPECGVARFLALLNGPWATLIVRELLRGPHRFTELRDGLPGISPRTLTSVAALAGVAALVGFGTRRAAVN